MNRKGQGTYVGESWADLILVPIFLLLIAVIMLVALFVYDTIKTETELFSQEGKTGVTAEAISDITVSTDTVTAMYPYIFVMLVASMLVLMAMSAYLIDSSIVFLVPGIIILAIAILISVPMANFYEELTQVADFSTQVASQSIIVTLMANMPVLIFLIGAAFLLIMYGKKSAGRTY